MSQATFRTNNKTHAKRRPGHQAWPILLMNAKDKNPNSNPRPEDYTPDNSKGANQKVRDLRGGTAGDRGMCEKQSTTQGSE